MTIVCGIDFSENGAMAAEAAAAVARRAGEPLRLVHVIAPLGPLTPRQTHESIEQVTRDWVRDRARDLGEQFGVEVQGIAEPGNVAQTLVSIASAEGARLVVVSSLGQQRFRWLLGSVAERVAQTSPVPVLVVRDAARLRAWALDEMPLRVLVGVDLGVASRAALQWTAWLRSIGRCDVTVTQVAWPFGEHVRLGLPSPPSLDRLPPDLQAILARDLCAWVGELPGEGELTCAVSPGWGPADLHLAAVATRTDPDLVVIGIHRRAAIARLWHSSVSRGILHHATTNVACVPRSESAAHEDIPTFRRVLVPTDFSPVSNRAIPVAYGLVAPGGVVHLLHVITGRLGEDDADPGERLRSLIPQGAAARGVHTEIEIMTDEDAATGIWHAAGRLGVDAICMATHGRTGAARLVLGSQANEVVQRSRHPVLLVPAERR